jgi:hypothetical protein
MPIVADAHGTDRSAAAVTPGEEDDGGDRHSLEDPRLRRQPKLTKVATPQRCSRIERAFVFRIILFSRTKAS